MGVLKGSAQALWILVLVAGAMVGIAVGITGALHSDVYGNVKMVAQALRVKKEDPLATIAHALSTHAELARECNAKAPTSQPVQKTNGPRSNPLQAFTARLSSPLSIVTNSY